MALDEDGQEVILSGKGIGYRKAIGYELKENEIQKIFVLRERTVVRDVGVEQVRKEVLPYIRKLIYRLIDETIDENVWRMREEKENFAVDFFSDAFITFLTEYMLENEKMDEKLMVMNFHFLFTQFF